MPEKTVWGLLFFFLFTILLPLPVSAGTSLPASPEETRPSTDLTEYEALKRKMKSLSVSAAESGLNSDYLPGMITVLHGKDLAEKGIGTVGEAMTLVPGIAITADSDNNWSTVVRGLPKNVASGQIKFLLNGEPMLTTLGIDLIPNIPIEQIEKIEMVRGPASVMYGESAFAGVLNVVTKGTGNDVFAGAGSYDSYLAGGNFSKTMPDEEMSVSINLAFQNTRRGDLDTGAGRNLTGSDTSEVNDGDSISSPEFVSRLYDRSDDEKTLVSTLINLDLKGFVLEGHYIENGQGDFYSTTQQGINLKKKIQLAPEMVSCVSFGWYGQNSEEDYSRYIQGGAGSSLYDIEYRSESFQGGVDVAINTIENHSFLIDWFIKKNTPVKLYRNTEAGEEYYSYDSRLLNSLMVQDTWSVTDQLTLTYSVRGDFYDDLGEEVSPRLAAVYRLNRQRRDSVCHLLKTQAARAVRPLSFPELYDIGGDTVTGGGEPAIETIDSIEAGYIVRTPDTTGRVTTFYSEVESGAGFDTVDGSLTDFRSFGVEVELEQELFTDCIKLDVNGSWVHAEDKNTEKPPEGSSEWLANAGLSWHIIPKLTLALNYRFISEQATDSIPVDEIHSTDITVVSKLFFNGLTLRAGVKNIFEEDVRYPSHLDQDRIIENSTIFYPGDFQRPERWWWVRADYDF